MFKPWIVNTHFVGQPFPVIHPSKEVKACAQFLQWQKGLELLGSARMRALELDLIACSSGIHLTERAGRWPLALEKLEDFQRWQLRSRLGQELTSYEFTNIDLQAVFYIFIDMFRYYIHAERMLCAVCV